MIAVDTSALMCIVLAEPEHPHYLTRLKAARQVLISTVSVVESRMVAYGKGTGHPAGLNFGDVFAYALAKTRNLPLLFKGNDFCHTDVELALSRSGA